MIEVACSCSVGREAEYHSLNMDNMRSQARNVDQSLIRDNVILEDRLKGRSIEKYTNDTFQPVIDEYNERQKRKDRRIDVPYTEWHRNNGTLSQGKGKIAYECVLQVGEHDTIGRQYYEADGKKREQMKAWFTSFYKKQLDAFQADYPHLKVLYAAIHFDEPNGTPHMHLCFQPEAECTRGLPRQVSVGRALSQDGIERLEKRADAKQEGFQLTRLYAQVRDGMNRELFRQNEKRMTWAIKQEQHGRTHIEKSAFGDLMALASEKLEEATKVLNDAHHQRDEAEVMLTEAKNNKLASQKKLSQAEAQSSEMIDRAQNMIRQAEEAQKAALARLQELQKEIEELTHKKDRKEALQRIQNEIYDVYASCNFKKEYPTPHKVVKEQRSITGKVTPERWLVDSDLVKQLYNQAEIYDQVAKMMRELKAMEARVERSADTDASLQRMQEIAEEERRQRIGTEQTLRHVQQELSTTKTDLARAESFLDSIGMMGEYKIHRQIEEHQHSHHR